MIYRKPNGDLNLDIDKVLEKYPELAGATDDDAEQKVISIALVPYLIREIELQRQILENITVGKESNTNAKALFHELTKYDKQYSKIKGYQRLMFWRK